MPKSWAAPWRKSLHSAATCRSCSADPILFSISVIPGSARDDFCVIPEVVEKLEFIALARQRPKPSPLGTPQGGLSCPFGAIHLQVAKIGSSEPILTEEGRPLQGTTVPCGHNLSRPLRGHPPHRGGRLRGQRGGITQRAHGRECRVPADLRIMGYSAHRDQPLVRS